MNEVREFHLFADLGGGIYGGHILGHTCCGGVEIDEYCQSVLRQRQDDGYLPKFPIYSDVTKLSGSDFKGKFDILCGGFPCQAFSHAARGRNIKEKNLWMEMFRFVLETEAPIVFTENVTLKAIEIASEDLKSEGYRVSYCKLSCSELGANHRRDRYWLLAVKDETVFELLAKRCEDLPKVANGVWATACEEYNDDTISRRDRLKAIGNAQSPIVVACVFRILAKRLSSGGEYGVSVSRSEIDEVCTINNTWIDSKFGSDFGLVHTPTTMANYSAPSMMKHLGCRNFVKVFGKPTPRNAEYLMGLPFGSSDSRPQPIENMREWDKHFNSYLYVNRVLYQISQKLISSNIVDYKKSSFFKVNNLVE